MLGREAVGALRFEAIHVAPVDEVGDTGDGIGTVNGRRTVGDDFDAADAQHRDHTRIGQHGFTANGGHAVAVEQGQRREDADIVDVGQEAAGAEAAGGGDFVIDAEVAELRHQAEQFRQVGRRVDLHEFLIDADHRRSDRSDPANAGAGHHDFRGVFGLFIGCCGGRLGGSSACQRESKCSSTRHASGAVQSAPLQELDAHHAFSPNAIAAGQVNQGNGGTTPNLLPDLPAAVADNLPKATSPHHPARAPAAWQGLSRHRLAATPLPGNGLPHL